MLLIVEIRGPFTTGPMIWEWVSEDDRTRKSGLSMTENVKTQWGHCSNA